MSDDDPGEMQFDAFTSGATTPFGALQDPTAVSVTLSGFTYGADAGWEWFRRAVEAHKEALDVYVRLLRAADGDVTDPRVKAAASMLHNSVGSLPVGHAAYSGVGFPSADGETPRKAAADIEDEPRVVRGTPDRLHPYLDTALRGARLQRYELASQTELPIEVELILAKDPDTLVRQEFVSNGTRSRSAMLLMERDETDDEVRRGFAGQRFASPELKLPLPIADIYWDSLDGVADLLGLDDTLRARLQKARDEVDYASETSPTVADVLEGGGWVAPGS